MKYFVNAPAKRRKSRKRRTAAQERATKKMIAANKRRRRGAISRKPKRRRTTRRSAPVARKRRRSSGKRRRTVARTSSRRRRRSSTAKRRSPVTRLRRNRVYMTNPRRKRRGRRYHRNPNIMRQTIQLTKDTGAVLAGSAAGGVITGFLPDLGNPFANAAKGLLVAIGVKMAAQRFLGGDVARFAAAGAMQVPLKTLLIGFLPPDQQVRARALLGDYGDIGAYAGVITDGGGVSGYAEEVVSESYGG